MDNHTTSKNCRSLYAKEPRMIGLFCGICVDTRTTRATGWRRSRGCRIFRGLFPQKSFYNALLFLQKETCNTKAVYASSPCDTSYNDVIWDSSLLRVIWDSLLDTRTNTCDTSRRCLIARKRRFKSRNRRDSFEALFNESEFCPWDLRFVSRNNDESHITRQKYVLSNKRVVLQHTKHEIDVFEYRRDVFNEMC